VRIHLVVASLALASLAHAQEPAPSEPAKSGVWAEAYDKLDHVLTLESLNKRADDMQRKIVEIEDRVMLLRESAVLGAMKPSRGLIVHRNELGSSFTLDRVTYILDGQVLLDKESKDGSLDKQLEFEVLNGTLNPGVRRLEVVMHVTGSGTGLFSYFKGYKFKIASKYALKVAEGRLTRLDSIAVVRPDITLQLNERLGIKYDLSTAIPNE